MEENLGKLLKQIEFEIRDAREFLGGNAHVKADRCLDRAWQMVILLRSRVSDGEQLPPQFTVKTFVNQ
jgi:hypothetical protein